MYNPSEYVEMVCPKQNTEPGKANEQQQIYNVRCSLTCRCPV